MKEDMVAVTPVIWRLKKIERKQKVKRKNPWLRYLYLVAPKLQPTKAKPLGAWLNAVCMNVLTPRSWVTSIIAISLRLTNSA